MAYHTLRQEYMQMPPVTRAYTTACVLTTLAVVCYLLLQFIGKISKIPYPTLNRFELITYYSIIFIYILAIGCCVSISAVLQSIVNTKTISSKILVYY